MRTRTKTKKVSPYKQRDEILKDMGFDSYRDYLKSDLWKDIRNGVLRKAQGVCVRCQRVATQVHHMNYYLATPIGDDDKSLLPVCRACHDLAEFKRNGHKRKLGGANSLLLKIPPVKFLVDSKYLFGKRKRFVDIDFDQAFRVIGPDEFKVFIKLISGCCRQIYPPVRQKTCIKNDAICLPVSGLPRGSDGEIDVEKATPYLKNFYRGCHMDAQFRSTIEGEP